MEITWLQQLASKWSAAAEQKRLPHAVLLAGPPGTGKRALAAWMVRRKLGLGDSGECPDYPWERPTHADLHWLARAEDRQSILIDQVRDLVQDLALTSYEGRGKAAVIEPANEMNVNAANSLLKTLEEPPGDTLLVLVADRPGRLPATIFSRCQRLDVRAPAEAIGLEWLDRLRPGTDWTQALRSAGGAPIAAIAAADRTDAADALARDFAAVGAGEASPVEIAENWSRQDAAFVLEWLARAVEAAARSVVAGARAPGLPQTVLQRMDSRNLFCYLDQINRLRAQPAGSYNVQLSLEGLLIDWATGLKRTGPDIAIPAMGMAPGK